MILSYTRRRKSVLITGQISRQFIIERSVFTLWFAVALERDFGTELGSVVPSKCREHKSDDFWYFPQ